MQGAAPDIRDQHQAEIRASTFLSRWEASGAYSPLRHVLVRGAFGRRSDTDDSTYWRGHQYEAAAGTYWPLGDKWLVGGLGGYGQGRTQARFQNGGQLILPAVVPGKQYEFNVRFNKVFGEAYVLHQISKAFSLGATCRLTQLHFTRLTDQGAAVDLRRLTRFEPMLLLRLGLAGGIVSTERPIQLQLSLGGSLSPGYNDRQPDLDASRRQLLRNRGYVALGVGILPHHLPKLWR
jgi:hypothetical protein